jgi:bifunctional non-homologous end joining protein LigD
MALETYRHKRNFKNTSEPEGKIARANRHRFVAQEHHASHLHFDFRLEMGGVLKSWAVPKGPSLDPAQKRLAVMTEDHPVSYLLFEGRIAEGNYGAGQVRVWDHGRFEAEGDPLQGIAQGHLHFQLFGEKLRGSWTLRRMKKSFGKQRDDGKSHWLLIKAQDEYALPGWKLHTILPAPEGWNQEEKPRTRTVRAAKRDSTPRQNVPEKSKNVAAPVSLEAALSKRFKGENAQVKMGEHVVALTHLNKVLWPQEGYTKRDLLRYYAKIADALLPHLENRPLILKRYPNGVQGTSFFQHNVENAPEFLQTAEVEVSQRGRSEVVHYALANDLASLLYLANSGNIAFSPWHSRVATPGHPDWIVFDLDPGEVGYDVVCQVALWTREILKEERLACYAKTSGATGMHVYLPAERKYTYDEAAALAERVARRLQKEHPATVTLERALKQRAPRAVYFDTLQNAEGKTVVAPYSVRALPGAPVSAPLEWSEVERCPDPQAYTIANLPRRWKTKGDLFAPVLPQALRK